MGRAKAVGGVVTRVVVMKEYRSVGGERSYSGMEYMAMA